MTGRLAAHWRDAIAIGGVGLAVRLAVVAWAWRFPPAADGTFYQRIAERIAQGHGYTWLWPDGAVTFAAHYPVGYPAALGALYAVFGPAPGVAMAFNAFLGAVCAVAVHRVLVRVGGRALAAVGAGIVAVHPGLVAYTPALMTEGVTAALVTCAVWSAARARDASTEGNRRWVGSLAVTGVVLGAATMVRPQSILLAPALAWIALGPRVPASPWRNFAAVAIVAAGAVAVCAPWTARNCSRMGRCAFVSVNAGWNLLIGADAASTGAWAPVQVPDACKTVWDEAQKDACFGREARRWILDNPGTWASLVPRKLAATFDYCGAAPWYLHASSPERFGEGAKRMLQVVETIFERLVLVAALVGLLRPDITTARRDGDRRRRGLAAVRLAAGAVALAVAFARPAWIAHLLLVALCLVPGGDARTKPVRLAAGTVIGITALTHAVFFGAGRYSLVVMPLLAALAALAFAAPADRPDFDNTQPQRAS